MATEQRSALLGGPILRSLLRLAVPIVLANLLQAGYQMVDAFWVGRLGGAAVAAVSVSTPVTFLTLGLGTGFAIAGSVLIAQYYGAGNQHMVGHVAAQTLLMVILVSLVLGTLAFIFTPDFLRLLRVAPDVYEGAVGFLRVSFVGLVFNFMFFVFQSIMRGVGQATIPVWIVLATVVLNFALDPLFIYGWGPVPGRGVMGAALATLSTQIVAAVAGMVILLRGRRGVHLRLRDFRPDWKHVRRAFRIGLPASIEQSMRALGLTMMTFLIASFGTETVASYGAGSTLLQVVMIPALGLSMALSTLVAQHIGAGLIARAERIARLGALLGFGALTVLGIVAYLFAPQLVAFFVPEDQVVIRGGSVFLRTMCLAWGFLGLQMSLSGVLRASGNMVQVMLLTIVSQWVLQFPLAWVLAEKAGMGARGIWWAFPVTNVVMSLVTLGIFAHGDWKKRPRLTDSDAALEQETQNEAQEEEGALR